MIKIYCIHPNVKDIDSFLDQICFKGNISPDALLWSDDNPDVLFVTEWAFYRQDLFRKFKSMYGKSGLKVGWMGEAVSADRNVFDYIVGFDRNRDNDDRFIRLPSPLDMYHRFITATTNEITGCDMAYEELSLKKGFCNFLYSNPHGHPMRDSLFYSLGEYKKVDSLGKHLNNVGIAGTGYIGHSRECSQIKRPYKFSIAAENAVYDGYTSEKLLTSLAAHNLPIYWGNPSVAEDVNPECFIDASSFKSLEEMKQKVIAIDSDPDLWAEYIRKPWFTGKQIAAHAQRTEKYKSSIMKILCGEATNMAPEGFHVELYRKQFFKDGFAFSLIKPKIKKALGL